MTGDRQPLRPPAGRSLIEGPASGMHGAMTPRPPVRALAAAIAATLLPLAAAGCAANGGNGDSVTRNGVVSEPGPTTTVGDDTAAQGEQDADRQYGKGAPTASPSGSGRP